jgi:hypothetical protein
MHSNPNVTVNTSQVTYPSVTLYPTVMNIGEEPFTAVIPPGDKACDRAVSLPEVDQYLQNQEAVAPALAEDTFFKYLAKIFSNVLRHADHKLITNILDRSGKIIIAAEELVKLIALMTKTHTDEIIIEYQDKEPGCFAKINFIKSITAIKVSNTDFHLQFNKEHNELGSVYGISMSRVFING